MEKEQIKDQLFDKIERLKKAIEINESYDLPTDIQYEMLRSCEKELAALEEDEASQAECVSLEEVELKSPFRRDPGQIVKNCLFQCTKATEDCGMGILGHCSGCDRNCECIRVSPTTVLKKDPDERIWSQITKGVLIYD